MRPGGKLAGSPRALGPAVCGLGGAEGAVLCDGGERKLASSPAPVREVDEEASDEEASELRTEVGGGLTLPIGKEVGEAPPPASTGAANLGG